MSEPVKFEYSFTAEGLRKQVAMRNLARAQKKQVTAWLSRTVRDLKWSASKLQKHHTHTSHLQNNIGMKLIGDNADHYSALIGTGVGGAKTVKYARIQDKGGTINAKGKYLTIPFKGVVGNARSFNHTFLAKGPSGGLVMFQKLGRGKNATVQPLFILKRSVRLEATNWFTGQLNVNRSLLEAMMQPAEVLKVAEKMGAQ
jgi:hypothetical protein